ncbi:MAG: hypothetical protein IJ056_07745 [Acidaminococcaceae bacterium]|nr:hypothetical protein [Acidaminococcaceae bacterium]MBQ9697140.1 hypothetical protein [Acidaminococcaceae bacterium]MBR1511500.1 hypothetical protein [Acidaminococcaceae bacterium]MBR1662360.1 hypothetical protein [Acidaminococcaceae bacterium]
MAPVFVMKQPKKIDVSLDEEKQRLEKFLQSLDSHRYHRIIGDAANYPFFLDPEKMYTLRELPEIFPVKPEKKIKKEK